MYPRLGAFDPLLFPFLPQRAARCVCCGLPYASRPRARRSRVLARVTVTSDPFHRTETNPYACHRVTDTHAAATAGAVGPNGETFARLRNADLPQSCLASAPRAPAAAPSQLGPRPPRSAPRALGRSWVAGLRPEGQARSCVQGCAVCVPRRLGQAAPADRLRGRSSPLLLLRAARPFAARAADDALRCRLRLSCAFPCVVGALLWCLTSPKSPAT
jgi:hypothetical protein